MENIVSRQSQRPREIRVEGTSSSDQSQPLTEEDIVEKAMREIKRTTRFAPASESRDTASNPTQQTGSKHANDDFERKVQMITLQVLKSMN